MTKVRGANDLEREMKVSLMNGRRASAITFVAALACACSPVNRLTVAAARPPVYGNNSPLGSARPGAKMALSPRGSDWVDRTLASLTLRQKVGQLIMPWVGGEYAAVGSPEFEQVRKWVTDDEVGGVVISIGEPLSYAVKLNELQSHARIPLLVASDFENGPGFRMSGIYALPSLLPQGGGTAFPPVMAVGAARSPELAFQMGQITGTEARAVGVHLVFGPVLDVNANPLNPVINTRSFGESASLVSELADEFIKGARSTGVMTTAKHYPGHGDTDVNSHLALPTIRASRAHLDSVDLPPFRSAVTNGIDAIMTAHIAEVGTEGSDAAPATLSPLFMNDILRGEMGFRGLLITDAMTMGGIAKRYGATEPLIRAIEAGNDILLMPRSVPLAIETVLEAVKSGRLSESRIDASVRRLLTVKARAGLIDGRMVSVAAVDSIVNVPAHQKVADEVAARSITLGLDRQSLIPVSSGGKQRILSLTFALPTDLTAGTTFDPILENAFPGLRSMRVDSRTSSTELDKLRVAADSFDLVLVSVYVSPVEYVGSIAADTSFAAVINGLAAQAKPVIFIAFGSPYLVSAFPSVSTYLFAWGGAPVSQRAGAAALLGRTAIAGKLPVSIPPLLKFGDGLVRAVR
ncbi:MAG: hypothetical protein H0W63_04480 [Gemmatimonadaceae bacterium]|nr:hypothetical protein [Gemmatimonadaceae bacterium]